MQYQQITGPLGVPVGVDANGKMATKADASILGPNGVSAKVTTDGKLETKTDIDLTPLTQVLPQKIWKSPKIIIPVGSPGQWDEKIREIGNVLFQPSFTDKRYVVAYSGWAGTYTSTACSVGIAISQDGETWTKLGPVAAGQEDPYLVKVGSTYYLYTEDTANNNIKLFTSPDLVTWSTGTVVLNPGAAGTWDYRDVSSPFVWVENGTYYLFYEGRGTTSDGAVGLATSSDGINFTKYTTNPVAWGNGPETIAQHGIPTVSSACNIVTDDITKIGDTYYMIVHGYPVNNAWYPFILKSNDLVHWSLSSGPFDVSTFDGTLMWYPPYTDTVIYATTGGIVRAGLPRRAEVGVSRVDLTGYGISQLETNLPGAPNTAQRANFINAITVGTSTTAIDIHSPVRIERLAIITEQPKLKVHLFLYDINGEARFVPQFVGYSASGGYDTQFLSFELLNLAGGECDMWKRWLWKTSGNQYVIGLKCPLNAMHGYKLVLENPSDSTDSVRVQTSAVNTVLA